MAAKIGNLLIDQGLVSTDQLKEALQRQRRFGGRLASCCLAQGYADEKSLARVLAGQQGVPFVVLSRCCLPLAVLELVKLETARKLQALPLRLQDKQLLVALSDPADMAKIDELRFLTGLQVIEHGALQGVLEDAIEEAYRLLGGEARFWQGADFDPSQPFGDEGYLEIVVGGDLRAQQYTPAPGPGLDDPAAWVADLAARPAPRPEQKAVLVVDDEPEILQMLAIFLGKSGYQVWTATDGTEAVRLLSQRQPAAIVLDAMLPGIHGFDICKRVKGSEATRDIVVVMISAVYRGWRYSDDVKRLYGADAFLEKPLRLEELKHVLDEALRGKSAGGGEELGQQAAALLYQAAEAFRRGELALAVQQLEQAIDVSPFSAHLHHRLGLLYDKLGEHHRACAALERAIELEPEVGRLVALARLYEKTGFRAKAFESWERALRLSRDESEAASIKRHLERLLPGGGS